MPPAAPARSANGINVNGQVVGALQFRSGVHAFLYTSSTGIKDLGTLGGADGFASHVNPSGLVVGAACPAGQSVHHAFLYSAAPA